MAFWLLSIFEVTSTLANVSIVNNSVSKPNTLIFGALHHQGFRLSVSTKKNEYLYVETYEASPKGRHLKYRESN